MAVKRTNEDYIREALQATQMAQEYTPSVAKLSNPSPMRYPHLQTAYSGAGVSAVGGGNPGGIGSAAHQSAVQRLLAASGGRVKVVSGTRSSERQAQLFNAAVKKYGSVAAARKWVAPPGHSMHEKGLAVDLGGDLALAHQLAPQFGLYFPMAHEPWHAQLKGSR